MVTVVIPEEFQVQDEINLGLLSSFEFERDSVFVKSKYFAISFVPVPIPELAS